jgi:hypothetical protein
MLLMPEAAAASCGRDLARYHRGQRRQHHGLSDGAHDVGEE